MDALARNDMDPAHRAHPAQRFCRRCGRLAGQPVRAPLRRAALLWPGLMPDLICLAGDRSCMARAVALFRC